MRKKNKKEVIIPHHPHDPARRWWFLACTTGTIGLVVAGWGYFFTQQLQGLSQALPATANSLFFLEDAATSLQTIGTETVGNVESDLGPETTQVLLELKAATEQTLLMGQVLDEVEARVAAEATEESPEQP